MPSPATIIFFFVAMLLTAWYLIGSGIVSP
jgi:hypothetical protein